MVAFRASRLVCSAIALITLITSPICAEDSPSLDTVTVVRSASAIASADTVAASLVFTAISRMLCDMSAVPVATVFTFIDTSSADAATCPARSAASSSDPDISPATPDSR